MDLGFTAKSRAANTGSGILCSSLSNATEYSGQVPSSSVAQSAEQSYGMRLSIGRAAFGRPKLPLVERDVIPELQANATIHTLKMRWPDEEDRSNTPDSQSVSRLHWALCALGC